MKLRKKGIHNEICKFKGGVDVYIHSSTRVDRLFQNHRGDMWIENSENLLGDVNKTSDGYSQAKDPCILTSSQTRVAAQKLSLQYKDASGIIARIGALMRCLGSDSEGLRAMPHLSYRIP